MGKDRRIILRILISCHFLLVDCVKFQPIFFSVVGPKTLRIDEPYNLALVSHSATQNITVKVGIVGASYDGQEYEVFDELHLGPGETTTTKLHVRIS